MSRVSERFNPLNPAQKAEVDQIVASIEQVENIWPYNAHLLNDVQLERVILDRLHAYAPETIKDGHSYLLFGEGLAVEVQPDAADVIARTHEHARRPQSACDGCGNFGVAGLAVIAIPRNLVAVALCDRCAREHNPTFLIPIDTEGIES